MVRVKSLHQNLGDRNVVFHRNHTAKKNRRKNSKYRNLFLLEKKKKIEQLKLNEIEKETKAFLRRYTSTT